jgi:hypothetical protein
VSARGGGDDADRGSGRGLRQTLHRQQALHADQPGRLPEHAPGESTATGLVQVVEMFCSGFIIHGVYKLLYQAVVNMFLGS